MKIYLAARYSRRDEMRIVRDKLQQRGHIVTSRWLDENEPLNAQMGEQSSDWYRNTAEIDFTDIWNADHLLFFSEDPRVGTPRGGRHVEFGIALALEMAIHTIGPRENIFHFLTDVTNYASIEDFYASH